MADGRPALDSLLADAVARSQAVAALEIGRGAVAATGRIWRETLGERPALILADDNTWGAAGAPVEAALTGAGIAHRRLILPGQPRVKPTREIGDDIAGRIAEAETLLALGSGVLNDLAKYAAFTRERPYLCVATAASMDGYTSGGAPLSDNGFKITIPCRPPVAVIGDLDVVAAAPAEMAGWGYGDLAGKVPAGADWILADALGIEPVDAVAWPMVQDRLRDWLADPQAIAGGDFDAIWGLFAGLALVGLAMEAHGSSRPASGADHQIAHLWEMENLTLAGERVSHGACVALGCVATLSLYDWLIARDLSTLDIDAALARAPEAEATRAAIARAFPDRGVAERAEAETAAKALDPAAHRARLERVQEVWPALRTRLSAQVIPAGEMAAMLRRAGAPAAPEEIGVTRAKLRATVAAARFLRRRYTVLDLLHETGLLSTALDDCFGKERR
ncbi:glycerol-1-phosphate dehydrogenase [NAD(P)+] [Rhodovulum sp. ES.010]|uniref:sn-glycerol-1-phosphate dehydrogenase n=1 Tax=Rhodovulum sp. ES.010 TaxID=1882821 RepID=UPI00092A0408|nr:sn-glycerol-1-phosphate dehydrogenase [Rhodovulum sp. ES.010]SIO33532.1 glycerol-1-phosphate dehydrogenase [NAD(P)+] [Rhodovulum sp. ES.010]